MRNIFVQTEREREKPTSINIAGRKGRGGKPVAKYENFVTSDENLRYGQLDYLILMSLIH